MVTKDEMNAADAMVPMRQAYVDAGITAEAIVKVRRILDLYQRIWNGRRLKEDEFVLSTDEKK